MRREELLAKEFQPEVPMSELDRKISQIYAICNEINRIEVRLETETLPTTLRLMLVGDISKLQNKVTEINMGIAAVAAGTGVYIDKEGRASGTPSAASSIIGFTNSVEGQQRFEPLPGYQQQFEMTGTSVHQNVRSWEAKRVNQLQEQEKEKLSLDSKQALERILPDLNEENLRELTIAAIEECNSRNVGIIPTEISSVHDDFYKDPQLLLARLLHAAGGKLMLSDVDTQAIPWKECRVEWGRDEENGVTKYYLRLPESWSSTGDSDYDESAF